MVMPHELTDLAEDVVNGVQRRGRIYLGFAPLPETFAGVVLGSIRGQGFEHHPIVLGEQPLDGTALVQRGVIQDHDAQGLRKALMELGQELQEALRRAAWGTLPIAALGAQRQGAQEGRTVTPRGRRDCAPLAWAPPAPLDGGFMGKRRCITAADLYGPLRWADAAGGDHCCHPGVFFAAVGALGGTVVAQRL
jgi:hypothetical protein